MSELTEETKIDQRSASSSEHYDTPAFESEVASHRLTLRGTKLTVALAFVTGTGFTLFGYDQGVMSSLLTARQFERVFPQVIVDNAHRNHATLQSLLVAIYEIGCFVGALSNLWVGDKLGRRRTIVLGGIIMIIGAILQATSYSYAQILVARVVTGLGNGLNTSTVPAYHAECSPASKRGSLIMIEGTLITFGIMISYWIDFAFFWAKESSAQWRTPVALQIIFALIMVIAVNFLPESPRWLVKDNRPAEAMAVISALEDKPPSDPELKQTFQAILEAVAMEEFGPADNIDKKKTGRVGKVSLRELFTGGRSQNFRRVSLGIVIQCFQQITGINLITYYAANRIGRRKLMLFGATSQCLTMVLLAILGSVNTAAARVVSAVLLFVFNSVFAVGWLGMTWLYPAEIVGLRMRGPANALSTASNWLFNFLVVMITGPSFENINWGTYIVFASLNAFIIPIVYIFFPETAGRSLEDMDIIFALAYNEGVSPVKVSFRKDLPQAGSPEANVILGFEANSEASVESPEMSTISEDPGIHARASN
ncbi:hypothetical protein AX17_000900 [Amanita inopinata Kibby_2008]|nr:hypothetical protein AX17_000900 [Amanita inopinata Kibby_2008]